jgi:hypothetical protein
MAQGGPPRPPMLTKEKTLEYMKVFNELDTNRDGSLSREEIGEWLRGSGFSNLTDQQVEVSSGMSILLHNSLNMCYVCYEIVLRKLSAFCVHFQGNPSQVLIVNL